MKILTTNPKRFLGRCTCFLCALLTVALIVPSITALAAVAPPLGTINTYAILAKSTATSTGAGTVNGDVGVDGVGGWVPGTPPATVNGTVNVNNAATVQAQIDLTAAYTNVDGQAVDATIDTELGNKILGPGVYDSAAGTFEITGDLTLNGNDTDVWIFKAASTLTTAAGAPSAPGSRVILTGGAKACNVYWKVGSSATIGTYSVFNGNILAQASITVNTKATMCGSAWARTAAVTFNGETISSTESCCYQVQTSIELSSFTAKPGNGSVTLIWTTQTETDNVGFNMYRAETSDGVYVQLNDGFIPAKGSAVAGATYAFIDNTAKNRKTYYYKLGDIDLSDSTTIHGPVNAMPRFIFGIFGK